MRQRHEWSHESHHAACTVTASHRTADASGSRGGGGVVELDQTGFTKGAVIALLHSGKGAVQEGLEEVLGLAEGLALGGAQALVLGD